ncbi:hypothetical protein, partial [Escherichia coli]|uniref:hypothetical protein n=1 Tax=Escherichia coli TaxID=562 RepID=UPI00321905E7
GSQMQDLGSWPIAASRAISAAHWGPRALAAQPGCQQAQGRRQLAASRRGAGMPVRMDVEHQGAECLPW